MVSCGNNEAKPVSDVEIIDELCVKYDIEQHVKLPTDAKLIASNSNKFSVRNEVLGLLNSLPINKSSTLTFETLETKSNDKLVDFCNNLISSSNPPKQIEIYFEDGSEISISHVQTIASDIILEHNSGALHTYNSRTHAILKVILNDDSQEHLLYSFDALIQTQSELENI